jgi:hypothetical protein
VLYFCYSNYPFTLKSLYLCFPLSIYPKVSPIHKYIFFHSSVLMNPKRNKPQTVLIRILTNYIHAFMIFMELSFKWSFQFETVFSFFPIISQSQSLISLECLYLVTENYYLYLITSNPFYEILLVGLLPIAFGLLSSLIWLASLLVKKFRSRTTTDWKDWLMDLRLRVSANIFVIVQVLYPSITNACFSLFNCMAGPNQKRYLKRDVTIICWERDHLNICLSIGLPIMIFWILGFPTFIII